MVSIEKKKITKTLLAESLKFLMKQHPFEKITIKMITDEAGVIRPTFYNYFCDKYEVLEWIFQEEVIHKVKIMFDEGMHTEGIKLLFVSMNNDHEFYKRAYEVHGQNSFKSIVKNQLYDLFIEDLERRGIVSEYSNPYITSGLVAEFYALTLADVLKEWTSAEIAGKENVDHLVEAYEFLLTHSIADYISKK